MNREVGISIRHVGKDFGEHHVLQDIDLEIAPGEFVAIVGKSGCGKSTLLRLITQLDEPTTGEIVISGGDASGVRFLFQEARLLPWKRVWKNIALVSPAKSKREAVKALEAVGLSDKQDAWPGTLSGGQKQRVSLARALSSDPSVLLLDEPLGALDALTRIEMQGLIERLWLENGFTAVLVTHDVSEAVYLADRIILIDNGVVTMSENIELARPRARDADFAWYEGRILGRLLHEEEKQGKEGDFVI